MTPKLQISSLVLKRLEKVRTQCSGCLFGVWYRGTLLILGFNIESSSSSSGNANSSSDSSSAPPRLNFRHLQNGFPAELDLCGLVKFGLCTDAEAHMADILQDVDVTDNPILLHCELGTTVGLRASLIKHGQVEQIPFEVVDEQQLWNEFAYTRLTCTLEINCAESEEAVKEALQKLRVHLASGRTGFNIRNTEIYLMGGGSAGTTISGCTSEARITDLLEVSNQTPETVVVDEDDGFGVASSHKGKANSKSNKAKQAAAPAAIERTDYETLSVRLLLKMSSDSAAPPPALPPNASAKTSASATTPHLDESPPHSGDDSDESIDTNIGQAFALEARPDDTLLTMPLLVTSLALLNRKTEVLQLYDILIEGLCRAIRQIEGSIVEQQYMRHIDEVGAPRTYVFMPAELGHFFSCVYFTGASDKDEAAMTQRRRLHETFGLSLTRPQFRKSNRFLFTDEPTTNGTGGNSSAVTSKYLVSPHLGLKGPAVAGGRQALVNGRYTYYHYMQDGFNDNGWGCAYRSLQTLCSWFRWQGYTEEPVPDHRQIQKYLVRIGDKPHSFAGSKQWIGSMEVSMCMDGFMGVQCRILRVDSGADLAEHGATLVRHFETHGTPIMIGGGVLAHTILGVDFNASSGDLKFLILDPHYTGTDDLAIVLAKRWCAWKGTDFWDKKSYYNLCMPQLPTTPFY